MTAYEKLKELQITLPVGEAAVAAVVPSVQTGNRLFSSGTSQTPWETLGGEIARSPHHRRRKACNSPCSD
jgi:hypothetical protein